MLLDWSYGPKVSTLRAKHRSAVIETIETKQLEREIEFECVSFYMPAEEAMQVEVKYEYFIVNILGI